MSGHNVQLRSTFFVCLWIFFSGINSRQLQGDVSCGDSQSGDYLYDAPIPGLNGYQSRHRKRRSVIADKEKLWKDGKIPFIFDAGISGAGRRLIRKAMTHWENGTCVRFVERKKEIDYMLIYRGKGCCSHVGRLGGLQRLSLGTGCLRFGIIVHELGHAIGFYHEQNRPDRSSYIDILYNNVDRTKYANFDVKPENEVETFDQAYDYKSIMHYGAKFFSKNGYDTIRAKSFHSINPNSIGEAYYSFDGPVLSKQDILKANLLYKCSNSVAFGACGGSLSDDSGSLNIQGLFTASSSDGKTCVWIITPRKRNGSHAKNVTLTLSFDRFDVGVLDPETGGCRGAFVEVREGKGFLSPLISQFCGKSLPRRIISTSPTLYLRLQILPESTKKPIRIDAAGHYKTNECSGTFKALRGVLQSPAFPRPYERNLDCIWHIKIPQGYKIAIHFVTFLMHDFAEDLVCSDYLDLYEGSLNGKQIGRFCGSQKPGPFFLSTNEAVLVMHSGQTDIGIRGLGFSAVYEAQDVDECKLKTHRCPHVCLNYNGGYGCACHEGYYKVLLPDSADSTCIDADECQFSNGQCSHRCVNTAGSYFCACPTGYFLSSNKKACLDIDECTGTERLCSQECHNYAGGYRCACRAGYLLEADGKTCIGLPLCGGYITLPVGDIKSPVIPISYEGSLVCRWKINTGIDYSISMRIELPWVKNKECKNYLLVKHKAANGHNKEISKLCSSSDAGSDILVKGHSFVLEYHAQFPFQPRFQVKYHSIATTKTSCNRVVKDSFDWFQTPGYPFRYPYNKDCRWTITSTKRGVTRLVFTDFEVENHERCAFDYVVVEEHTVATKTIKYLGKFCGKAIPSEIVASVGANLIVTFHSDATVSKRGFRALVMKSM